MICKEAPQVSSTSLLSARILQVRKSSDLSSREKLVARVLLDHIGNREDGVCWPSQARIAREASVSVRTVQRAVQGLIRKGYISSDPRHREDGGQTSSIYRWLDGLVIAPPQAVAPPPDKVTNEHKQHPKKTNKKHVSACHLDSDGSQNRPDGSRIETSKRFAAFEANAEKFLSFESCDEAHQKAVAAGFISESQTDQILFWTLYAAICRKLKAKKVSKPANLLRFLLDSRKAMVTYGTQADEDAAMSALKTFRRSNS